RSRQRGAYRLHDLRLDRQHQHIAVPGQLGIVGGGVDAELAVQSLQLFGTGIAGQYLAGLEAVLQHAADEAGSHVAGADESDSRCCHLIVPLLREWSSRGRRTARCRYAPGSSPRRWPRPDRRSCPWTGCPAAARGQSWPRAGRAVVPGGRGCRWPGPGRAATALASSGSSARVTPDLLASPLMFTCRQIFSGGSWSGRWADSRWAIFRRSTLCTQSKCSAMARVLFDWIGPMKCQTSGRSCNSAILDRASCRQFSPMCSMPAATASRMSGAARVLLTAIRVTSAGSRPTACAARKMRIRTFAIFSAIVDITDVEHLANGADLNGILHACRLQWGTLWILPSC